MANNTYIERLTFEKGVMESLEESSIPPGFLAACQNWVPEPSGGLRARVGWLNASVTSAPATRDVKGIGVHRASIAYSTVARVRTAGARATSASGGVTVTFGSAGAAGDRYIAVVTGQSTTQFASIDTPANWTKVVEVTNNTTSPYLITAIFERDANGVTACGAWIGRDSGAAATGNMSAIVTEYSGLASSSNSDKTATNIGTTTSGMVDSGTTAAPTQASELFVAGFGIHYVTSDATVSGDTEGFAEVGDTGAANYAGTSVHEKFATSTVAAHMTATASATDRHYAAAIATFKAATAAATSYDSYIAANVNSSTEFKLYSIPRASLSAGTWTLIDTISSLANTTLPVAFANALGYAVYTHPNFTTTRKFSGTTASAITDSPVGNCIAFHRGRFYIANGTRLRYSGIGDASSWPADNYLEVGQDDGDLIQDILSYAGQLIIAKRHSMWSLEGSGPDNFNLSGPLTGGGYPGRCLCPTPFGVFVAGEKRAHLWSGSAPEEVSKLFENTYSLAGSFVTTAYTDSFVSVVDHGSSYQFNFNIANGTWWKTHVQTNPPQTIFGDEERMVYGPTSGTTISLLAYRSFPGTRGRDVSMTETFSARTAEMHRHGPDRRITPRYLYLTLKQRGTGSTGLTITPYYDGVAQTLAPPRGDVWTIAPRSAAGVYRERIDLGSAQGVDAVQFAFSQVVGSSDSNLIDIEDVRFEYETEDAR